MTHFKEEGEMIDKAYAEKGSRALIGKEGEMLELKCFRCGRISKNVSECPHCVIVPELVITKKPDGEIVEFDLDVSGASEVDTLMRVKLDAILSRAPKLVVAHIYQDGVHIRSSRLDRAKPMPFWMEIPREVVEQLKAEDLIRNANELDVPQMVLMSIKTAWPEDAPDPPWDKVLEYLSASLTREQLLDMKLVIPLGFGFASGYVTCLDDMGEN